MGKGFTRFHPDFEQQQAAGSSAASAAPEGFCQFQGSLVDVAKLVTQLERAEKSRSDSDRRLREATKAHNELKETSEHQAQIRDRLQTEVSGAVQEESYCIFHIVPFAVYCEKINFACAMFSSFNIQSSCPRTNDTRFNRSEILPFALYCDNTVSILPTDCWLNIQSSPLSFFNAGPRFEEASPHRRGRPQEGARRHQQVYDGRQGRLRHVRGEIERGL